MKFQFQNDSQPLYMRVYAYYKNMINDGSLTSGQKLPSVRRCSEELGISRTTVENAYMQLAADGYIISKRNSGFYVSSIHPKNVVSSSDRISKSDPKVRFDFASASADAGSFNFDMWRRYIKSALRQDERLLSYGEPQGEYELREVIALNISAKRNVVCTADNIVVGAGVQSLLHLLCAVISEKKKIRICNPGFRQGIAVFRDHGWENDEENPDVIYVTPSNMNIFGEVMSVGERFEMIRKSLDSGCLIIEDDYGHEFSYFSGRAPSLQSLASGRNVIYMGTFSRLLLPSIRMSYMVLPETLIEEYRKISADYNQTASKTEQIALCQFIRDGHMDSQIRKLRKLYSSKSKLLADTLKKCFGRSINILTADSGINVRAVIDLHVSPDELMSRALEKGVALNALKDENGMTNIILSAVSLKTEEFEEAVQLIYESVMQKQNSGSTD